MINTNDILQTIQMIDHQHLDVRTITMGVSLLDCCDPDPHAACRKIYDKITTSADKLVRTGGDIEAEFGIPIVNKRISVTPMALVAGASRTEDYVPFAAAMDRAAKAVGVNFIGGFSALVHKGMTGADKKLIASIPEALAVTDVVCSSVNVGSTKAGINMDAVALMGRTIKAAAERTAAQGGRLRQAGGVLQRRGGQPLYGRGLPRRWGGRAGHQCGRVRPRRGPPRPPVGEGAAL